MSYFINIPITDWQRQDNGTSLEVDLRDKWVKSAKIRFRGVQRAVTSTDYKYNNNSAGFNMNAGQNYDINITIPSVTHSGYTFDRIQAYSELTYISGKSGSISVRIATRSRVSRSFPPTSKAEDITTTDFTGQTCNHTFYSPDSGVRAVRVCSVRSKKVITTYEQTENPAVSANGISTMHSGVLSHGSTSPWLDIGGLLNELGDNKKNTLSFSSSGSRRCEIQIEIEFWTVPEVDTLDADNVGPYSARLRGNLTKTGNANTGRYLEFADQVGKLGTADATVINVGPSAVTGIYTADISGLSVDTTYYFRAYAVNPEIPSAYRRTDGDVKSFTTEVAPPVVRTDPATDITINSAKLRGFVENTGGEDPTRYFEYGETPAMGIDIDKGVGGTGAYFHDLTGLDFEKVYHWRAWAENSSGRANGATRTFETLYPSLPAPDIESPTVGERLEVGATRFIFTLIENTDNPATKYHARLRIGNLSDLSDATEYESKDDQTNWQYYDALDDTWKALPVGGVDPNTKVRLIIPDLLIAGVWYWDCASHDGYNHPNTPTGRYGLNTPYRRLNVVLRIENIYVLTVGGVQYDVYNLMITETSNGELSEIQFEVSNEGWEAAENIQHNDLVAVGLIDINGVREDFAGRVRSKTPQGTSMVVTAIMGDGILAERIIDTDYPIAANEQSAAFSDSTGDVLVTAASHGYSNGDRVFVTDTDDYNGTWTVSDVTADTFILDDAVYVGDENGNVNLIEDVGVTVERIINDYCAPLTANNVNTSTGYYTTVQSNNKTAVRVIEELRRAYSLGYFVDSDEDLHLYRADEIAPPYMELLVKRGEY